MSASHPLLKFKLGHYQRLGTIQFSIFDREQAVLTPVANSRRCACLVQAGH